MDQGDLQGKFEFNKLISNLSDWNQHRICIRIDTLNLNENINKGKNVVN